MAGAFQKLADAVRGDDSPAKAQGYLKPVDTAAFARKLDLDTVAAERGAREQPPTQARTLDAVEQQITQAIESEWSWHGAELINNLKAYAARLVQFSVQTELANVHLLARNTLARLRDANHRAEADLGPLRETYISFRDELREFRTKNRLRRAAREPAGRLTTYGLLFVIIAGEAVMNGLFFAKGSDYGLVGGVFTAVAVSVANVVVAFLLGLFPMRWVNHRNLLIKLFGLLISLGGVAALLLLHGFAAHYREAIAIPGVSEEKAFELAIQSLIKTPFSLVDLNSFYLFGLGLMCSFLAIWKGYANDDPYPRYGAHYRRAYNAREEYSEEHHALFEELTEIKERTVAAIAAGIDRIPRFPQQAAQIRSEREAHLQKFRAYETSIEAAANQLLSRYRDANCDRRKTPPPAHFNVAWKLPGRFMADTSVLTAIAEPPTPPLDANAALDDLRQLSRAIIDEYEALLVNYPHPTQMQADVPAQ